MCNQGHKIWRVISEYRSAFPDPILLRAGQELALGDRESEWPGWLWCTDSAGKSGWVPDIYLERRGDTGILLRDYDATELSVRVEEELIAGQEVRGWLWCTSRNGQSGWVPAEHLAACEAVE